MKRVLFLSIVLVMLLGTFSSAFAAEPIRVNQVPDPTLLGDVWWFYFDFGAPGIRVDAYLYRPATAFWNPLTLDWEELGWPFGAAPTYGTWWWWDPMTIPENWNSVVFNDSGQRRQSWPSYQYTDIWGFYYAEFMFPRDEVWYPCSFPLKWKCNYVVDQLGTIQWHSPAAMLYECRFLDPNLLILECLQWPWPVNPMDTVSPLEVYLIDEYGFGYVIPFEVLGMYWKFSDFE